MEIAPLQRPVQAEGISLERLAENKAVPESAKIEEAARQFEAMLLRQILGEATKRVISSGLETESCTTSIYRDVINDALAESISQSRALGLGRALAGELGQPTPEAISEPGEKYD